MTPSRSRLALLLVALAVLLHVGWHARTVTSLLPHDKEVDAALVRQSMMMRGESEWSDHAWPKYPHLFSRLMSVLPRASELEVPAEASPSAELQAHLRFAARHLVAARWLILLLAALAIPLTYALARLYLPPGWSAVAALLFASTLLLQTFAHQGRPHAAMTSSVLAVLLASERWARRGGKLDLVLVGASSAVVLGSLHSGALFLLAPGMALLHRWRRGARPGGVAIFAVFATLAAAVLLFYPFLLEQPKSGPEFDSGFGSFRFPHVVTLERFTGEGFPKLARWLWGYDPVLSVLAGLGVVVALLRRRQGREEKAGEPVAAWVLFTAPVLYAFVIGLYENTYERFLLPVYPFLAVAAAAALQAAHGQLSRRLGPRVAGGVSVALTAGLLAWAAWPSGKLAVLHSRPDTLELAAEWVLEGPAVADERVLITASESLPLFVPMYEDADHDPRRSKLKLPWLQHLLTLPDDQPRAPLAPVLPLAEGGFLPHDDPDFPRERRLVDRIAQDLKAPYLLVEMASPRHRTVREYVERNCSFVTRFSPWGPRNKRGDELTFTSDHFRRDVLEARRLGPVLEVWRRD